MDAGRTSLKVNLFIVGAPKCGTTAWVEYLRTHPEIFFPATKDDCFFALDLPGFRAIRSEAEYSALFIDGGTAKVRGEASAMYLFSEAAAGAIRDHNPDARILIFLRAQEDFLPSLHSQFLREFAEEIEDFETAWRLSGHRPASTIPPGCLEPRTLDYVAMGRFAEQVERYVAVFPRERILAIHLREWAGNPRSTYLRILDFLDLPDDGRTEFLPVNEGATYRSRRLVRSILFPPAWLRKVVRAAKRATGFQWQWVYPIMHRLVRSLTTAGYDRSVDLGLREEIVAYYADDNLRLNELLATTYSREPVGLSRLSPKRALTRLRNQQSGPEC